MANLGSFEKFRGKFIRIGGSSGRFWVPTKDGEEGAVSEAVEGMAFEDMVEQGWKVIGISGALEDGEMVQSDGLLAVNGDGKLMVCSEGTNEELDVTAAKADIEVEDEDE